MRRKCKFHYCPQVMFFDGCVYIHSSGRGPERGGDSHRSLALVFTLNWCRDSIQATLNASRDRSYGRVPPPLISPVVQAYGCRAGNMHPTEMLSCLAMIWDKNPPPKFRLDLNELL